MGFGGRAADRIDNGIDLVALAERIEGRKGHADLRPERANDELAPAGRANGGEEIDVLPGVERRPVDGGSSSTSSAIGGSVGSCRPEATLTVECTTGTPNSLASFTVEMMFSIKRS